MSINNLEVHEREAHGSNAIKKLRKTGFVPGVLYGMNQDPRLLQFDKDKLNTFLRDGARMVELRLGDKVQSALLKDVQYDFLGDSVLHADFVRVDLTELLKISVPLKFSGVAKGQAGGGIVEYKLTDIEVECLPENIPEEIPVSIKDLEVGQSLHLSEVELPDGVTCSLDPGIVVVSVSLMAEEPEEEAEAEPEGDGEEATEPAVIQRKDKPEDEDEK